MLIKFLKNAASYKKGKVYDVPKMAARVLIHTRQAIPQVKKEKQVKVPSNRAMTAAAPKPVATPRKRTRRKAPPKKKNEYQTKALHDNNEEQGQ